MLLLALTFALQAAGPDRDAAVAAVIAAEDARARTSAELAVLTGALRSADTVVQGLAVRALGRLERPELFGEIGSVLGGTAASVRIAAANAMAQAVYRVDGGSALAVLRSRVAAETMPSVRGAVLAAVGRLRLPPGSAGAREAELMLSDALASDGGHLEGALRGTWDLLRRQGRAAAASPATVAHLRRRAMAPSAGDGRRLALLSLLLVNAADSAVLDATLRAPDEALRRAAAAGLRTAPEIAGRSGLLRVALADRSPLVRIEAVRGWTTHGRTTEGCEPLIAATRDTVVIVQLLAIDGLGGGCGPMGAPVELLDAIAIEPLVEDRWHRPVRALLALAAADTGRAALRLGGFAGSPIWWVRMHSAAAAQRLGDRALLIRLAADPVDNVREAALRGLVALDRAAAEPVALTQLTRADYQLLIAAAGALRQTTRGDETVEAALATLARVTAETKETSRDARMALLDRIDEFATAAHAERLLPYLRDFDPVVAERVAALLTRVTGVARSAEPVRLAAAPLPTPADLRAMRSATIVLRDGRRLEVRLRPEEAPANVARFVAMARSGWFSGLTLHRVVPNFVLQGGSPGANEYAGGAEFTRDEVGGSHRRGTIGISTRGRDTGDGQIFINLVDNLQLDHEYTVIGEVVAGLELLESVLEGTVIERIELPEGRP